MTIAIIIFGILVGLMLIVAITSPEYSPTRTAGLNSAVFFLVICLLLVAIKFWK
jgi:hypothetical protein